MKKMMIMLVAVFTLVAMALPVAYASAEEQEIVVVSPTLKELPAAQTSSKTSKAASKSLPKGITPRTDVPEAKTPVVEVDNANARLLVRYKASDKYQYMVGVSYKGGEMEFYTLYAVNADEYFPLAQGNGKYTVWVCRVLDSSGRAALVYRTEVKLEAKKNAAFLSSNYFVKWEAADQSQKYVNNLEKKVTKKDTIQKLIYTNVVKMMNYDSKKAQTVTGDYVPDLDSTLKTKKGICYDTAALMAGMMRYADVPTRLVMGYTDAIREYHAWNEVLIDGKWVVVDATYDAVFEKAGQKYSMAKKASVYHTKIHQY